MTLAVHIGYHKTASTWLQKRFFTSQMGFHPILGHDEIDRWFVRPHDLDFDPNVVKNELDTKLADIPSNAVPIVSSEILSGHPFFGGRESASIAKRLYAVAPDAQVIVSIRSQVSMLPSVYMQYLQRGGTLNHEAFFAGHQQFGYPSFEYTHFQYDRLIKLYQALFEKVHVLTYEEMTRNPQIALSQLRNQLGQYSPIPKPIETDKVSASVPEAMAPVLRCLNQTRVSTLNPNPMVALSKEPGWMYRLLTAIASSQRVRPLLSAKPVRDYVEKNYAAKFSDSNGRLDQITGNTLDLSDYP